MTLAVERDIKHQISLNLYFVIIFQRTHSCSKTFLWTCHTVTLATTTPRVTVTLTLVRLYVSVIKVTTTARSEDRTCVLHVAYMSSRTQLVTNPVQTVLHQVLPQLQELQISASVSVRVDTAVKVSL